MAASELMSVDDDLVGLFREHWGDAGDDARIRVLCGLLDHVPLAVERAARRLRGLPIGVCEEVLADPAAALDLLADPAPAYDDLLIAAVADLAPVDRQALFHLSAAPGDFTLTEARMITDRTTAESATALRTLAAAGLLRASADDRFHTPHLVLASLRRHHPHERRHRLSAVLQVIAARSDRDLGTGLDSMARQRLIDDAEAAGPAYLLDVLVLLVSTVTRAGDDHDLEARVRRVLAEPAQVDAAASRQLTAAALLSIRARRPRGTAPAIHWVGIARERARSEGDPIAELEALRAAIELTRLTADLTAGAEAAAAGIELARTHGSEAWLARFEAWAGMYAHQAGDVPAALAGGRRALGRARRTHDRLGVLLAGSLLWPFPADAVDVDPPPPPLGELVPLARALHEDRVAMTLSAALIYLDLAGGNDVGAALLDLASEAITDGIPPVPRIVLVLGVLVAERQGAHEQALIWAGVVEHDRPALAATIPPVALADLDRAVTAAREAMGPTADAARRAGHLLSIDDALHQLVAWCRGLRAADENSGRSSASITAITAITEREQEVLALVASGLRNKQIGERLGISTKTVMHHTVAIYRKLGVAGRSEATAWAVREGLA